MHPLSIVARRRFRTFLLALPVCAGIPAVQAAEALLVYCTPDSGCGVLSSGLTPAEAEVALDGGGRIRAEQAPVIVIAPGVDGLQWTAGLAGETPAAMHAAYGGSGEPEALTVAPELGGEIALRAGQWVTHTQTPVGDNCLPMVMQRASGFVITQQGAVDYSTPFTPGQVMAAPQIKWIKTGPNSFAGAMLDANNPYMRVRYGLTLVSELAMDGAMTLEIAVPDLAVCTVTVAFTHQRVAH